MSAITTEATGEPRVGRLERTLAKSAMRRLRELGMALPVGKTKRFAALVSREVTYGEWSEPTVSDSAALAEGGS